MIVTMSIGIIIVTTSRAIGIIVTMSIGIIVTMSGIIVTMSRALGL